MGLSFGDMLVNRRRQMGLSIQQVANTIKMRPQIIEYFETSNFEAMPPRGYAQGMISSYARFLGLNPREVVDAYYEGLYLFEHSAAGASSSNFTGAMDARPRSANDAGRYLMVDGREAGSRFAQRPPQAGYVTEIDHPTSTPTPTRSWRSQQNPGLVPARNAAQIRGGERTQQMHPARGRTGHMLAQRGRANSRPARERRNSYAGTRQQGARARNTQRGFNMGTLLSDRRFIVGCLALIALLLIAVFILSLRACTAPATTTTVVSSADSGSTTTTDAKTREATTTGNTASSEQLQQAPAQEQPQAPSEYHVKVAYTGSSTAWIEIRVDGQLVAESGNVVKGFSHEYIVKQSIEISTNAPADVEVTKDGERVRYDSKSSGIGKILIRVPAASSPAPEAPAQEGQDAAQQQESTGTA
ncbi:helix-turn-helix domain-containing protein [Collinsella sp. zg1085]|uniref:helix-turn-helix domain-containing protein n=1 Tax=Collinsella sp. zg1085 TaxID=2844380 RepID=UPI001C0B18FC|nr:helix-turn-helix transcriptional regulator [Collinsella sp. zg1085]QWT16989.1 helix-turn-helix domain-containing protein [Collinsella sp. zg1085]